AAGPGAGRAHRRRRPSGRRPRRVGVVVAVLVLLLVATAGVALYDAVRRPTLRRLAMRNVGRRRGEALLVVAGSLLGTAIITASFIVGDSLGASVRDSARTQLGPIDEV